MSNQNKVRTTTKSWLGEVRKVDPKTDREDPPVVYRFSNNKTFVETFKGPYA